MVPRDFRRFRSAFKLTEKSGETQRDSLLYIMGSESEIFWVRVMMLEKFKKWGLTLTL